MFKKGFFDEKSDNYFGGQGKDKYLNYVDDGGEVVPYVSVDRPEPEEFETYEEYVKFCEDNDLIVYYPDGLGNYGKSSGTKLCLLKYNWPTAFSFSIRFSDRTPYVIIGSDGYMHGDFIIKKGKLLQRDRDYKTVKSMKVGLSSKITSISEKAVIINVKKSTNKLSVGKWKIPLKNEGNNIIADFSGRKKLS